jgi:ParB-like chromosome segregation protein Spo0J
MTDAQQFLPEHLGNDSAARMAADQRAADESPCQPEQEPAGTETPDAQAIGGYPVHSYACMFEMLEPTELARLAEDIRLNGQHEPIIMYRGQVLDGRNRLEACMRAGVEPRFVFKDELDEQGAFNLVLSRNVARRHLDASQRAMIAASLVTGGVRARSAGQPANLPVRSVTQADAAELMHVSERSVRDAVAVFERAPAVAAIVRRGDIPLYEAAKAVRNRSWSGASGPQRAKRGTGVTAAPKVKPEPADATAALSKAMASFAHDTASGQERFKAAWLAGDFLRRIGETLTPEQTARIRERAFPAKQPAQIQAIQQPHSVAAPRLPWEIPATS